MLPFLKRLQLNSSLNEEEQRAILALNFKVHDVLPGRDLIRPGDETSHATLVSVGSLGRFDTMRNGSRQITAIYIPGDMCDLQSVVAPVAGWGITSLGRSTVLHVAHSDLRALSMAYPNIALAFWRDTTLDASILAKWVANIGRKDARARIAHLFCELGIRMERAGLAKRTDYELRLTQEQIGDTMGLTSVHVNRILRDLRECGFATAQHQRVVINDWGRLANIAEFSPTFLLYDEQR